MKNLGSAHESSRSPDKRLKDPTKMATVDQRPGTPFSTTTTGIVVNGVAATSTLASLGSADLILHMANFLEIEEYGRLSVCSRFFHQALESQMNLRRPFYYVQGHSRCFGSERTEEFRAQEKELIAAGYCASDAMARAYKSLGGRAFGFSRGYERHYGRLGCVAWRYRESLKCRNEHDDIWCWVDLADYIAKLLARVDLQAPDWAAQLRAVRLEQMRLDAELASGTNYFSDQHARNVIPQ